MVSAHSGQGVAVVCALLPACPGHRQEAAPVNLDSLPAVPQLTPQLHAGQGQGDGHHEDEEHARHLGGGHHRPGQVRPLGGPALPLLDVQLVDALLPGGLRRSPGGRGRVGLDEHPGARGEEESGGHKKRGEGETTLHVSSLRAGPLSWYHLSQPGPWSRHGLG